ncbi:MAG: hypothetical protein EOO74_05375 [Myxococcales bacterium]|nr:MAG: hypothetical protein EOO74_05375 [Myxococcales bacterium]
MSRRDQRGSITPFVVIVSLAIIMLAALVIDGGRQLNAKGRAIAYAQEAARAGSQAVDVADPRLDLVPAQAVAAARAYCEQAMALDEQLVQCTPSLTTIRDGGTSFLAVRVEARIQARAILLGIINRPTLQAGGVALARPVSGIGSADSGKESTLPPPEVAAPGDEDPGDLGPPDVTVSPCVPIPESPTAKPTPDKPKDSKSPGGPKPSDEPTEWPPPLEGDQEYCIPTSGAPHP